MEQTTRAVLTVLIWLWLAPVAIGRAGESKERNVGKGVNLYSVAREIALGRQLAQEVEKTARLVDDPAITEYVNRVAQNLAKNSDLTFPVSVRTIDSNQVNAFALPGGFLFVNTGVLMQAETEAELASVMAHEIAHAAARHGTRQASRATLVNIASVPLIFLGGWAGYGVRQAAGLAVPLTFLKFSRGFEKEADRLGVEYLHGAGYDPPAFVDFLEKLQALEKTEPGALSEMFRSHPPIGDRIRQVQNAQKLLSAQPLYVVSTSEFSEMQAAWQVRSSRRRNDPNPNAPTLRRPGERLPSDGADERPTLSRKAPEG